MSDAVSRVTICGAFGGVNAGDEAIAQTMQAELARAFPGARIGLLCFVGREVLDRTGYAPAGADVASRQDWGRVRRWLRQGPLVIGGGQMLNGARLPKGLAYLWLIARLARVSGQRVMILGVGARAIAVHPLSRLLIRAIARSADVIRVRDAQTRDALVACGVPAGRIALTADVVFSGTVAGKVAALDDTALGDAPRAGYCFAVHHSPLVQHYTPADFAGLVDRICQAGGQDHATLVCHDIRPAFDLDFAHAVAAAARTPCTVVLGDDVNRVIGLYHRAALVVSSRMHPLILGLIAGAPVLPLAGSDKVAALCRQVGGTAPTDPAADLATLAAALDRGRLQGVPEALIAAARANFAGLGRAS